MDAPAKKKKKKLTTTSWQRIVSEKGMTNDVGDGLMNGRAPLFLVLAKKESILFTPMVDVLLDWCCIV
jgi:hypothetical protein